MLQRYTVHCNYNLSVQFQGVKKKFISAYFVTRDESHLAVFVSRFDDTVQTFSLLFMLKTGAGVRPAHTTCETDSCFL